MAQLLTPTAAKHAPHCAVVVVEGATVASLVAEPAAMLVIGLILSMPAIGLFGWLIFALAVYALAVPPCCLPVIRE